MIISGHAAPAVLLHIVCLFMLMKILLSCSHPAPDVTLRFVGVKNLSGFTGKGWVNLEEPFGNIWWCQGRNKKISVPIIYVQIFQTNLFPLNNNLLELIL